MEPTNNTTQNTYTPYQQPAQPGRKIIIVVIVLLALLIVGVVVFKLLANRGLGTVIVSTNDNSNSITIVEASPVLSSAGQPAKKLSSKPTYYHNNQAVKLKPGNYFINVYSGDTAVAKTITVTAGQTDTYNLNLPAAVSPLEPVGDVNTSQFVAGRGQILYLDSRSGHFYRIDSSNGLTQIKDSSALTVKWADVNFGVAQDETGTLYVVNSGVASTLNNLPSINGNLTANYAVAPNHDIYLGYGKDVYRGSPTGFKHIYTASTEDLELEASNDRVAVMEAAKDSANREGAVIVVGKDGQVVKKSGFEASVRWSPSGRYMATINEGPGQILDSSLKTVAIIPNALPQDIVWQNDSTLYYAQGSRLWQYNLNTGLAKVVSVIGQNQTLVNANIDEAGNYVYLAAQASSGTDTYFSLYRYGLKGQSVADGVVQLHSKLPWLTDGCFLSLVNFTRPTISVVPGNSFTDCISTAKQFVSDSGVSSSKFNYEVSSVLPSTPTSQ